MDATDLHTQTSTANKAESGEKIKMSFSPPHYKLPKELLSWSSLLPSASFVGEKKHPKDEDYASRWSN